VKSLRALRIWLLVLLAVLLPVRGTMAAAMLCAPSMPAQGEHRIAADHDHDQADDHAIHQHAEPAHAAHQEASHGDAKCNLCCDLCSVTTPLSALPSLPTPQDHSSVSFPDLSAPAPSFLSDGQERPPRST